MPEPATDEAFTRYREVGGRHLRNQLVYEHRNLVELHVRRFPASGAVRDDVRQVAYVALIHAVERFDPSVGVKFSTFADRTIAGELKRFARDHSWTVRPPRALQERYVELQSVDRWLTQELGRRPTVAELAAALRCSVDLVHQAIEAGQARRSLAREATSREEPDGEACGCTPSVIETGFDGVERRLLVRSLLDQLPEVERSILELTVLQGRSQDETAAALGLSQSFVSRTRRHALLRIRRLLDRDIVRGPAPAGSGAVASSAGRPAEVPSPARGERSVAVVGVGGP